MAELVDALVSGTSAARRGGSSPLLGTIIPARQKKSPIESPRFAVALHEALRFPATQQALGWPSSRPTTERLRSNLPGLHAKTGSSHHRPTDLRAGCRNRPLTCLSLRWLELHGCCYLTKLARTYREHYLEYQAGNRKKYFEGFSGMRTDGKRLQFIGRLASPIASCQLTAFRKQGLNSGQFCCYFFCDRFKMFRKRLVVC